MNSDLSKWSVVEVTSLMYTFSNALKYTGVGLHSWDVSKVNDMGNIFYLATSLTSCSKRNIVDAWKSITAFTATTYGTDWAGETCNVRVVSNAPSSSFKSVFPVFFKSVFHPYFIAH